MVLHTFTPQPMSLPSINILILSEHLPAHLLDTMGENNTRTALKGCGVIMEDMFGLQ